MSLVHVQADVSTAQDVDLESMSTEELTAIANAEHALVCEHLSMGIVHGIKAGEALWVIKNRRGATGWDAWVVENTDFGRAAAKNYCRWAYYKDVLLSADERLTAKNAGAYLKGLPQVPGARGPRDQETVEEVKRLREEGKSQREIADLLGVSKSMVDYHTNPHSKEKRKAYQRALHKRQRDAARALAAKEKADAIRKAGGNIATAYSYVRKAAAELDAALGEATSPEVRTALRAALAGVHKAEDEIGNAVRRG